MRETTFVPKPFVNEFDQTVNPGDEVIYAGTAWKQTRIKRGIFEGVYEHPKYGVTAVRVGGVPDRRYRYDYEAKKGYFEDVVRKAVLPLKRVYPMNTSLAQLDGKRFG